MALFARRTPVAPVVPARGPRWAVRELVRTPEGVNLLHDDLVERLQGIPEGDEETPKPKPAAASTEEGKNSSPSFPATIVAAGVFVIGLLAAVAVFGTPDSGPTFKAAEGIGAFALFYIAAQASERFVELFLPAFEGIPGFGKAKKEIKRDKAVAAALQPENSPDGAAEQEAADAQAEVDQLRANRTAVVFGLTAALGMVLCGYLEADFLTAVGVTFASPPKGWDQILMMAATGLIVGGGSKALHDTITGISTTSEKKKTPPETGGQP